MNASTFSARVTGSTLANPYTVVSAAIGTLTGPLHGGANEEVLQMLDEIGTLENVRPWMEKALANKHKIMGFGHRVYKVKDPRASVLQEMAEDVFVETGRPKMYEMAMELERLAAGAPSMGLKGVFPNVDFYSGIVYQALGIPRDLFTPVFAIARVAGWLSHWLEQVKNNRIFRPEQVYVGKRDVHYEPLEKRP
jgi:citrate synthase